MSFENIVGHDRPKSIIERILDADRLAHGYIFEGPPGVGKTEFALALARRLACEGDRTASCDCRNCKRIYGGNHPGIKVLSVPEDKQDFPVDLVRDEVVESLGYKSIESGWRVFIFNECEKMTQGAANVLLKTLEEPPDKSLLILECASADQVIDTLVSRCQRIRFGHLNIEQVAQYLEREMEVSEDEAIQAARLSGGSIGKAADFLEKGFVDTRNEFVDILERAVPDTMHESAEMLISLVKAGSLVEQRKKVYPLLETFQLGLRDRALEGERFEVFEKMAERLETARKLIEENTNIKFVMLKLVRDYIEVRNAS